MLLGVAAYGGEEATPPPPPVSYIEISPPDTLVAVSDSVRLGATAYGLDGAALPRTFRWSGEPTACLTAAALVVISIGRVFADACALSAYAVPEST
ncbi:MAG: hypothetical protein HY704_00440 [Gemmatimonadetes bacterium]|nr:hypothetical protein [Gemmatimonadota bacterium]